MTSTETLIHCDPNILSGIPVFVGTRVPVKNLIDYLAGGDSLDDFFDSFPCVSREQAVATLRLAEQLLVEHADSV